MRKLYASCLILLCIFLANCNNTQKDNAWHIDVLEGLKNSKEINLSAFVDSVEYVKLESSKESFLRYPQFQITDNYIIATSRLNPARVLLFNRKGKLLRQIGRTGKGPGEFVSVEAIARNEEYILLHDYGQGKLIKYDYSGKLIKSMEYTDILKTRILQILPLQNNGYALCMRRPNEKTDNFPLIRILNENLELEEDKLVVNVREKKNFGLIQPTFYLKDEKIHLREFYFDTLYVENKNDLAPEYHFAISSKPIPESVYYESPGMKYFDYNRIIEHSEIGNYLCICLQQPGDDFFAYSLIMYDKNSMENFCLPELPGYQPDSILNEDDDQIMLIKNPIPKVSAALYNDIDGFYHLRMDRLSIDYHRVNDIIVRKLDIPDLKYYLSNEYHLEQKVNFPAKRDELVEIIQNSNEYDNPVLQIFHLKKSH